MPAMLHCFTKSRTPRMSYAELHRWMTAPEKMAASGMTISQKQSDISGVPMADWKSDCLWHARVGNGQHLQCIGLVWMSTWSCLRLKKEAPGSALTIEPCSTPDGLLIQVGSTLWTLQVPSIPSQMSRLQSRLIRCSMQLGWPK